MGLGFAQIASIKGSRSFVCFPSCVVQLVHGVWPREFAGVNKLTLNAPLFRRFLLFFLSLFSFFSFRAPPVNLSSDSVDFFERGNKQFCHGLATPRARAWKRSKNRMGFYCSRHQSFVVAHFSFAQTMNGFYFVYFLFSIIWEKSENRSNFVVIGRIRTLLCLIRWMVCVV